MNWALKQSQRRPSYIFAVEHSQEKEDSFYKLAAKHGQVMAFHGSKMENFYSILHNGFLGHLNKAGLQLLTEDKRHALHIYVVQLSLESSMFHLLPLFTCTAATDFPLRGGDLLQH